MFNVDTKIINLPATLNVENICIAEKLHKLKSTSQHENAFLKPQSKSCLKEGRHCCLDLGQQRGSVFALASSLPTKYLRLKSDFL